MGRVDKDSRRRARAEAIVCLDPLWKIPRKVSYVGPGIMRRSKPSVLLAEPVAVNR
jgi:hypothetical protein